MIVSHSNEREQNTNNQNCRGYCAHCINLILPKKISFITSCTALYWLSTNKVRKRTKYLLIVRSNVNYCSYLNSVRYMTYPTLFPPFLKLFKPLWCYSRLFRKSAHQSFSWSRCNWWRAVNYDTSYTVHRNRWRLCPFKKIQNTSGILRAPHLPHCLQYRHCIPAPVDRTYASAWLYKHP